jgi:hypothetical protein
MEDGCLMSTSNASFVLGFPRMLPHLFQTGKHLYLFPRGRQSTVHPKIMYMFAAALNLYLFTGQLGSGGAVENVKYPATNTAVVPT